MKEIWKDLKGYEGWYQVSSEGRVKSLSRKVASAYGSYRTIRECILKEIKSKDVTPCVSIAQGDGLPVKQYSVACLVLETFSGESPEYHLPMHRNMNFKDNRIENLYWITEREFNLVGRCRKKK
jgi:hypothetical protein